MGLQVGEFNRWKLGYKLENSIESIGVTGWKMQWTLLGYKLGKSLDSSGVHIREFNRL